MIFVSELSMEMKHQECFFINIKNRGGLILPSHNVIVICKIAETVIRFVLRESGGKRLLKQMSEAFFYIKYCIVLLGTIMYFIVWNSIPAHQTSLQNHVVHLIRAVAFKYIQIRLYFRTQYN